MIGYTVARQLLTQVELLHPVDLSEDLTVDVEDTSGALAEYLAALTDPAVALGRR